MLSGEHARACTGIDDKRRKPKSLPSAYLAHEWDVVCHETEPSNKEPESGIVDEEGQGAAASAVVAVVSDDGGAVWFSCWLLMVWFLQFLRVVSMSRL